MSKYYFTSESVTEGHPDKLCDYISDSILDACLEQDSHSRVAIETMASAGKISIAGEITTKAKLNIEQIAREAIKSIGYRGKDYDIDYKTCSVDINITEQSPDIALGTNDKVGGAGDQGIMFGYATNETRAYMPFAIHMAHKLAKQLTKVRKQKVLPYLGPDGKTQVTVEYEDDKVKRIETILISTQHTEDVTADELKKAIIEKVIKEVIPEKYLDKNTNFYVNPTGRFVTGGPLGDTGLTGRKIIVDTYGGSARHGGGAFSGKDATKVDRSAAYMMRHIAKNIVANGYADKCELQIAYAIGMDKPMSIYVNTFGTGTITDEEIVEKINKNFNLTPRGIIKYLELNKPIFRQTTNYGHFGKSSLPWEKVIDLK